MTNLSSFHPILDKSVLPQDDFFTYVNGRWLKENPIPKSETRWGTFNILRENAWLAMRDIFEDLQDSSPANATTEQQARDFYHTGMHFDDLKDTHIEELRGLLREVDSMKDTKDLSAMIGRLHSFDISGPWYCYVDSDHDDNSNHILHFRQSGLTLPNRDYYLDDSDKMKAIREAYHDHTTKVFAQLPELARNASALWETVIGFETALASASRSSADLRDVEKNYHKTSLDELRSTYSEIDWDSYASSFGWKADDKITIDQPEFMVFIDDEFKNRPLDEWKIYLKWRLTSKLLGKVSNDFAVLQFEFYGKILSGTMEILPLWKRVVLTAEHTIGEATGRLYAERHFPEDSKKQVLSLVEEIRISYSERIDTLDWMSDKTKVYAKEKLHNIKVLIGYPDTWRDFTGLSITRSSYLGNVLAAQAFEVAYWLERLHQPTSRDEWFMTPQTVNAYHDPNRLVICFPAGILQSPFFNPTASLAANLSGIGSVIGHELTHGFDDQGCMYDARGNVRTWQTEEERAAFAKKAQIIVDQADQFEVLPELTLRGKLVLGESIADLGGVELALHAFNKHAPTAQQLQEFFVNYAFTECSKVRDEKLREYTLSDPHPVSEFRVNGILQHVDDFYSAFNVNNENKLFRDESERAKIW